MPRTILIVDDSRVNRSILKNILAGRYETQEAAEGREALNIVRAQGEALSAVLLDLRMPGMDGFAFLEQFRREFPAANLPVIVMTGEDGEDTEVRALRLGATDFLSKPYQPQIILARLENLIKLRETAALVNRVERDSLTGLLNKEGFCVRLERLLRDGASMDLVAMDIGNFKLVNDLYGEAAGDELLRAAARCAERSFGGEGVLLGRKNGDQFLFAFPPSERLESRLRRESQAWEFPLDMNLPLRFGVCHVRGNGEPVSVLCDNAQMAADSIRGRYDVRVAEYDAAVRSQLLMDQELADDLEQGLRSGQFEAWYQPKCDPVTGNVVGAEALVRWNHPVRGPLSPDRFVPLFERTRLITKLDAFMWERTCRDLAAWVAGGNRAVPVSVNVSRVDVYQRGLARRLRALVQGMDIDPAMVPLEITESACADDPAQLADTIRALREQGFPVQMDDFGSGWSSLNMLTELPLDGVKLDMKFMQGFRSASRDRMFLTHLLEMLADLELEVTAEGVETAEQAAFLQKMGCRSAQGLYFSPALPREKFEQFLRDRL